MASITFVGFILPLLLVFIVLAALLVALNHVQKSNSSGEQHTTPPIYEQQLQQRQQQQQRGTTRRRRRGGLSRMQRLAANNDTEMGNRDHNDDQRAERDMRRAEEREARREEREARRDAMYEREERLDEERRQEEEVEREREERLQKEKEEKQKAEQEEYENWKQYISIEDSGQDNEINIDSDNNSNLLQKFIQYIQLNKVVVLETLAAEFQFKTQHVIDIIQQLQNQHKLSGFFDDRGKYIHVEMSEMKQIAHVIHQKGKISIQELAIEATKILQLHQIANKYHDDSDVDEDIDMDVDVGVDIEIES